FEKVFSEGVKKNEKVLVEILNQSAQMDDRASAAYLLAYLNDANQVASLLIPAIKDPEPLVRNNTLRVLGDIAERYKAVVLPSKPFLEALEFPRASDRSKAVFVVLMMSSGSQQVREDIIKSSIPPLLAMLKGNQPDQRDFSHNILRKVSGKEFPITDYLAWNNWYQKLAKERALTSGKSKDSK
ncbi:MAG: HEAT repeat domain-containing protein, partial [Pseudomonadota bacterium]